MNILESIDRIGGLVLASPTLETATKAEIRNLLSSIREQCEAAEKEKTQIATHTTAVEMELAKLKNAYSEFQRQHVKEVTTINQELAKLKAQNETPSISVTDQVNLGPVEPLF
jgi:uncharacterized protein (DUF3084 family)